MQRQPDTTKAKEILGWEAKVNREEGMKLTYDYFQIFTQSEELLKEEHKDFWVSYYFNFVLVSYFILFGILN
jgi:dTDP-glucose 4,6-dehydratase